MKKDFLVYCFCSFIFFSDFSMAEVNEKDVSKVNAYSEEILDVSIPMLFFIVGQSPKGNLIETSAFDADAFKKLLYQNLEKKGYVEIIRNAKVESQSIIGNLADSGLSFVRVSLTGKGVNLKGHFQTMLNNELEKIKSSSNN